MSEKLSMTDLVAHTIVTKLSVPKTNGTWVGNEHTSVIYLPVNATDSYKTYRKLREDALQRRAIWETLYHVAGAIDSPQYLAGIAETEAALKNLESTYKYESVVLLIINTQEHERVSVELFEDVVMADAYLTSVLGVTMEQVQLATVPEHLKGTRIFKKDWHCSTKTLIKTSMTPDLLNSKPADWVSASVALPPNPPDTEE